MRPIQEVGSPWPQRQSSPARATKKQTRTATPAAAASQHFFAAGAAGGDVFPSATCAIGARA
eukprot:13393202-Alexandrium_andersonii.AAC.1